MAYTFNKTCEECKEPFAARGARQKLCDSCWCEMMCAIRVEYRPINGGRSLGRWAIIVCRECKTEYVTATTKQKYPGLCKRCTRAASVRTPEYRAKMSETTWKSPERNAKISAAQRGKKMSAEALAKLRAANLGRKHTPETRAKMSEAHSGKKLSPETRARVSAGKRGKKKSPEHRAKLSVAHHERRRRGAAQGGKYGWIYVVSGPGQVKVGGSMDKKSLARRLVKHERNGLIEVHATWQVDPKQGSKIEAAAVAAALAEWEQVGTIVRPDGGTETVWCDNPAAIVALVESVITQEQY